MSIKEIITPATEAGFLFPNPDHFRRLLDPQHTHLHEGRTQAVAAYSDAYECATRLHDTAVSTDQDLREARQLAQQRLQELYRLEQENTRLQGLLNQARKGLEEEQRLRVAAQEALQMSSTVNEQYGQGPSNDPAIMHRMGVLEGVAEERRSTIEILGRLVVKMIERSDG